MPRHRWFDRWVDVYLDELSTFSLVLPRTVVADQLTDLLQQTAAQMRVTEVSARAYFHEADVRELARNAASSVAAEQPGADLMATSRPVLVSAGELGRALAALGIAGRAATAAGNTDGADQCLALVITAGLLLVEEGGHSILSLPVGWLYRTARQLRCASDALAAGSPLPGDGDGDGEEDPGLRADLTRRLSQDADFLEDLAEVAASRP